MLFYIFKISKWKKIVKVIIPLVVVQN